MLNPPGEAGVELSNWNWKVVRQFLKQSFDLGLRVADTSVMPDVVRANTNTTAMAIGERVADWMRTPGELIDLVLKEG